MTDLILCFCQLKTTDSHYPCFTWSTEQKSVGASNIKPFFLKKNFSKVPLSIIVMYLLSIVHFFVCSLCIDPQNFLFYAMLVVVEQAGVSVG